MSDEELHALRRHMQRCKIMSGNMISVIQDQDIVRGKMQARIAELESELAKAKASAADDRRLIDEQWGELHAMRSRETTATIAAWQHETFGLAITTWERVYRSEQAMHCAMQQARLSVASDPSVPRPNLHRSLRAAEELAELIEVLVQRDDDPAACHEIADVRICLSGITASHGLEQSAVDDEKMAINRARKYDENGQHIEGGEK